MAGERTRLRPRTRLAARVNVANDPFFGRGGRVMASSQRELGLKFELLVPIESGDEPTACMSFNYHQDHFASMWGIELARAKRRTPPASVCMERLALALFKHHDSTWTPGRPRSAPPWLSRVGRTRNGPARLAAPRRACRSRRRPYSAPKRKRHEHPPLRIGTRGSPLALAQTHQTRALLARPRRRGRSFFNRVIRTTGMRFKIAPSPKRGKGLFTKELDAALIAGAIDFAVHSSKDLPTHLPTDISSPAICPRGRARRFYRARRHGAGRASRGRRGRHGVVAPRGADQTFAPDIKTVLLPAMSRPD